MGELPATVSASGATVRGGLIAAIFLMATSAIGPGFITQTATFTAKLGAAFAFAILASIVIDFVVQMNIWRITVLTGRRASENANLAVPGAGGTRRRATSGASRSPRPIFSKSSSRSCMPSSPSAAAMTESSMSVSDSLNSASAWLTSRCPSSIASERRRPLRYWRIAERAFAVTTKFTHDGFGIAPFAVTISTVWPLRSTVRSGASRRSTLAATQRLPTSVCTAYAKSTTVAPRGIHSANFQTQ